MRTDYFHLTKELVSINYAPINEVKNVDISLETAWTHRNREWKYGVNLLAALQQRTGVENIFGDPTANVYPKISSVAVSYTHLRTYYGVGTEQSPSVEFFHTPFHTVPHNSTLCHTCLLYTSWLGKKGFQVASVSSIARAQKHLETEGADLILSDLRLPDKDGT